MKDPKTLLRVGVIGTVLVALCCFTPVLVILLGVVGLSALTGYLDYVLLPALAVFIGLASTPSSENAKPMLAAPRNPLE